VALVRCVGFVLLQLLRLVHPLACQLNTRLEGFVKDGLPVNDGSSFDGSGRRARGWSRWRPTTTR
jgi:hypothetical protein